MLSGIMTEKPLRLCEAVFCFLANLLQLLRLPSAEIVRYRLSLLTPPTIEIVGFLGGAARFTTKPCLKQRVMRFPTVRYVCSV